MVDTSYLDWPFFDDGHRRLAADLTAWLEHKPIQARPIGQLGRLGRWCKRKPAVAGLGMAITVTLALSIITSHHFTVSAQQEQQLLDNAKDKEAANREKIEKSRAAFQQAQRLGEIDRVSDQTAFNGTKVLDGSKTEIKIQVGDKDFKALLTKMPQLGSRKTPLR